jgi:hypothetical protein
MAARPEAAEVSVQVLVKTAQFMNGAYTYLMADAGERAAFVKRPDIWWYHFPEEDDDWQWHRGGAWRLAGQLTPVELIEQDLADMPHPGAVTVVNDDDEEDGRW